MASFLKRIFGGGSSSGGSLSHADMLLRAHNDLALKTGLHEQSWQIGGAAWEADLETGIIAFVAPDGRRITAPVQVIGTLDSTNGSWMWGWDHPSVPESLSRHAQALRAYGTERNLPDYSTQVIACDTDKAWDFAALASLLNEAQGAYRGPAGTTLVFMTFGTLTMSKGSMKPRPEKDFAEGLVAVEAPEVLTLVRDYCAEIFAIEKAYAALQKDEQRSAFAAAIADQQPIYDRYWRRDDDYWRPCSVSSRPESDLALTREWRVFSRGSEKWRVTYERDIGIVLKRGFDVERFADGLKITDALF